MNRTHGLRAPIVAAVGVALVAATVITMRSDDVRIVGVLGPTPGPNSQGHIETQRAYLARIARREPNERAAGLVSLTKLMSSRQAAILVAGMEVQAVFVTFPSGEPEALPVTGTSDLESKVATRAGEIKQAVQAEVDSLEIQVRDAKGSEKQGLEKLLTERRQALAILGAGCACVYAVAVQGTTLGALERLQERPEVRLVDVPNPVTDDLRGWQLVALLPSQANS